MPDLARVAENLRRLREEVLRVALDEAGEATTYAELAAATSDEQARWELLVIAADSILHRELAWAIARAAYEVELLARRLAATRPRPQASVDLERLRRALDLEGLAETSYSDLKELAPPGTTMRRLLELLESEEAKHRRMAEAVLARLSKQHREG